MSKETKAVLLKDFKLEVSISALTLQLKKLNLVQIENKKITPLVGPSKLQMGFDL